MTDRVTDYERMGSPPISVRCKGGNFMVDTPEGIHVFDTFGTLIVTRTAHLGRCRCGHGINIHDDDGACRYELWDAGEWCEGYCDCEAFEQARPA